MARRLYGLIAFLAIGATLTLLPAITFSMPLPAPVDIPQGPADIEPPGGEALPLMNAGAPSGAPAISAISEITFPDETLVITGERLDGASLRVWVEGLVFDVEPLRTGPDRMQAVVPASVKIDDQAHDTPRSMMLVWPRKGDLHGAPIRVNAATAWWVWPARIKADAENSTVRLFGKNLVMQDGIEPLLVLVDESGSSIPMGIELATPYELRARLPRGLEPGAYRLYAHNGTGGAYGWSEAIRLEVVAARPEPDKVITIEGRQRRNFGRELHKAVDEAMEHGGAVIELPSGSYRVDGPITVPEGIKVVFRGAGMGSWDHDTHSPGRDTREKATVILDDRRSGETSFVELFGDGSSVENMTIVMRSIKSKRAVLLGGRDQTVRNVRLVAQAPYSWGSSLIESNFPEAPANHVIEDCEFVLLATAIQGYDTRYVRISNSTFHGMYMMGRGTDANALRFGSSQNLIIENSSFRSVDRTRGKVLGRTALFGPHDVRNVYIAGNRSEWVGSHSSVPAMEGNVSEQYLFHVGKRLGGLFPVTSADALRVQVDTGDKGLPQDIGDSGEWIIYIARGRGAGQYRVVVGQGTDGALYLDRPWRIDPDESSMAIVEPAFRQIAIVGNYMNPAPDPRIIEHDHKTVGVYWYHMSFDTVTAGNTMKNIGTGVAIATDNIGPSSWNVVRENVFENVTGTAGGTSYMPVFFNEHVRSRPQYGGPKALNHWVSVGNVFRANSGRGADAAAQFGWRRFDRASNDRYAPDSDSGLMMTVVENNELLDVGRGVLVSAPSNWLLLRNNVMDVGESRAVVEKHDPERILDLLIRDR